MADWSTPESTSGLTSAFNPNDTGKFSIGDGSVFDFYGLFVYNRAFSDVEVYN